MFGAEQLIAGLRRLGLGELSTSSISLISHAHGRERRAERGIEKQELKEAVKYGRKERANPGRDGSTRWRYTHKGVVYITDETSRHEVTSWRLEEDTVPVMAPADPNATSHLVVVVDCSGSMRKDDVPGYSSRTEAVYDCLARDLVQPQLNAQGFKLEMSLIEMSDDAELVLDQAAISTDLLQFLKHRGATKRARSHGNYLPALDLAKDLFVEGSARHARFFLVFLSDGAPSDHNERECDHGVQVWQPDNSGYMMRGKPRLQNCSLCGTGIRNMLKERAEAECVKRISHLGDLLGRDRMFIGTVAFGPPAEDYKVLQKMAATLPAKGSSFQKLGLSGNVLRTAFTQLTSSLTTLCTEVGGGSSLTLRKDLKDHKLRQEYGENEQLQSADWDLYCGLKCISKRHYSMEKGCMLNEEFESAPTSLKANGRGGERGIAHAISSLAHGAERVVFQCTEVVSFDGGLTAFCIGAKLVAKQSLHLEYLEDAKFHHVFCRTQGESEALAVLFNRRLRGGPELQLHFLPCSVYTIQDFRYNPRRGELDILVERELEGKFTKWNDNKGGVAKGLKANLLKATPALGAIVEDDEEEEGDDDDDDDDDDDVTPSDAELADHAPQCFSHFTYEASDRQKLVCDLQGVWNSEDGFLLTDPVIHHHSSSKHNGATDKGKAGFKNFFDSHQCNALCKRLGLSPVHL